MIIAAGEFWIADIAFTNASGSKKQPVLVLWLDGFDVVVAAVTTAGPRSPTDVALADWKTSGLLRASTARLSRLDCLEQALLENRIGSISTADANRVKQVWATFVQPQF